jgi:polysaccharide export outer membrane protein
MLGKRTDIFFSLVRVCLIAVLGASYFITTSFAQQRVETTAETNSRIASLAKLSEPVSGEYKLGSGDLIGIEVFDVPQLSREVRISESGLISLPLLQERVLAKGLTTIQLQEKLEELLKASGLVTYPEVTVSLKEQRSQPITVIGSIKMPQVIQSVRPMSVLEVLSACGGITDDAGSLLLVTRKTPLDPALKTDFAATDDLAGPQTIKVDLWDLLNSPTPKGNIMLTGGDIVTVPRAGIFYVVGAVNHPGGFILSNDADQMTTLKALALASGTTSTAKSNQSVIVRKDPTTGESKEIPVDLRKLMQAKGKNTDAKMQANDILFVPDSAGKHALHRATDVIISLTSGVAMLRVGAM